MTDPLDALDADDQAATDAVKAQRKAKKREEDLKWLLAHKQGRRIAYQLLAATGLYRNPFNHSGSVTAYNCGSMKVGQQFLAEILAVNPDAYTQMCKEHANDD